MRTQINRPLFLSLMAATLCWSLSAAHGAESVPTPAAVPPYASLSPEDLRPEGAVTVPGDVASIVSTGNQVLVTCAGARLRLEFCTAAMVRVSLAGPGEEFAPNEPNMVVRYDWPSVTREVAETPGCYTISTEAMVVEVNKKPLQLAFYSKGKERLLARTLPGNGLEMAGPDRRVCRMELDAGGRTEHFFGLGIQFWRCDLRGTTRLMKMAPFFSAREENDGETHYVNPFLLSTAGYGIYLHSSAVSRFALGSDSPKEYSFETPLGGMDFYFFAGPEFSRMISAFGELSGRMAMPPRYALGLAYRGLEKGGTGDIFLKAAHTFRDANIPLDIIGTEPSWQTSRSTHEWSPAFTADPKAWIESMASLHLRVNLWERNEYRDKGMPAFAAVAPYTVAKSGLVDLNVPEARDGWFAGSRKAGFDLGAQGFKADENDSGKATPGGKMFSGMPEELYVNLHPMLMQANYWDQCRKTYNRRYFGWSRGGFTGAQRYPVAGYSDAFDFADYIRGTVNSGFWGAYFCPEYRATGDRIDERLQMMFFGPFAIDNEYISGALPVSSSGKIQPTYLKYDRLRYQLIPYIYAHFWHQHRAGIPLIRHTQMEFPDDPRAWQQDLQYFFGRDLLVAPLYANPRPVYLPEGVWIDYWTGERLAGGRSILFESKSRDLPLFVRAGAVIPMQPEMNYVDEKPADPLTLVVAPGNSRGFVMYDDDGLTLDYEKGAYAERPVEVTTQGAEIRVDIGALVSPGNFRPSTTTFVVKVLTGSAPAAVTVNGRALPLLADDKIAGGTDAGWWHTGERRGTTCVRIPAEAAALALKLPSPLDDAALYRAAYAEEVRLARQMLAAAGGAGGQQAAADLIGSALVESERLAAVPAKCDQALAALDSALSQAQALVAAAQPQRRALAATDSGYIGNGANADLNFSTKKELWVMRDTTAPDGEYKSFVRFDLTKLAETPKKAMLSLTCKDAGKPLPGHLEIHCMLHACSQPPDLKTVT